MLDYVIFSNCITRIAKLLFMGLAFFVYDFKVEKWAENTTLQDYINVESGKSLSTK